MAKVVVSPAVHNFTELFPPSRAVTMTPRPASRKSLARPSSRSSFRAETELNFTPRSQKMTSFPTATVISPGRRSFSVISVSSVGKAFFVCFDWICSFSGSGVTLLNFLWDLAFPFLWLHCKGTMFWFKCLKVKNSWLYNWERTREIVCFYCTFIML